MVEKWMKVWEGKVFHNEIQRRQGKESKHNEKQSESKPEYKQVEN